MLIGEIEKGATERIQVSLNNYKGRDYVDIRVYYESEEEWKPTKKGVTIYPDRLEELIKLLQKAKEEWDKKA
jgi:hypothetical protein